MQQIAEIISALEARSRDLEEASAIAQTMVSTLPRANLRITHNKGIAQYYIITDKSDNCGKYIRKKDITLAKNLAQRDYAEKLIKCAESEAVEIKKVIKKLRALSSANQATGALCADNVYSMMSAERRNLIEPILMNNYEYAERWKQAEYTASYYMPEEKVYITKKGEKVRSKSEVMLANMYYELGIPYRYEAELKLKGGRRAYPDFTLLDIRNRKEIYHEHMGLLDDENYRLHNFKKIDEYRKNDIFIGKNLIITHESNGCPLNMRDIEKSMRWLFQVY